MANIVRGDRVEAPGWAKPTVEDFFEKMHAFWGDYKKILDAVENRRLTREEAYAIVQRRFFLVDQHPMTPGNNVDYRGTLRCGLLDGIDDAFEESCLKPIDIRETTKKYVAGRVAERRGLLNAFCDALNESAVCRAFVGAATGSVAAFATLPAVPEHVVNKPPSYILAAGLIGAALGALYGGSAKRA